MSIKDNKKALRNYTIVEEYKAGIALTGAEVKSIKTGAIDFDGSFITIRNGEAWLINATITRYKKSGPDQADYNPRRKRKLLLNKKEIQQLASKISGQSLTIIPLSVYSSNRFVKLKIAIAKGKRKYDKRKSIKDKEFKRRLNIRHKNS